MSISELGISHLQQMRLSESAVGLLESLASWLSTLSFSPHAEEFEILAHAQLHDKTKPLLNELGLSNKAVSVVRVTGPKPAPFYNSEGSAYIIPIRVAEGSHPTVSGRPLTPGGITYITAGVKVSPMLDLLFVLQ